MTRFLASSTRTALLADLANAGFEFKDENGATHIPDSFEFTSNGTDTAIYLGHVPAVLDEEGNIIRPESTDFCANVTACEGITFATEMPVPPQNPYNVFG